MKLSGITLSVLPFMEGNAMYTFMFLNFTSLNVKSMRPKRASLVMSYFYPPAATIASLYTWCINSFWLLSQKRESSMYFLRTSVHSGWWDNFRGKKFPPWKRSIGQMDFPSWSKCCVCTQGMVNSKVSKWEMALLLNKANPSLTHLLPLLTCPPHRAGAFSPFRSLLKYHLPGDAS